MKTRTRVSIIILIIIVVSIAITAVPRSSTLDNSQIPVKKPISFLSTPNNLCNNEYMPVINDLTKVYEIAISHAGTTSTSTNYETISYSGDRDYFTVQTRLGSRVGYPVNEIWDCSNYGLTKSAFEAGEFSYLFFDKEKNMSTRQTSDWCPGGVTLPLDIHISDSWTQQTDFQFTGSNPFPAGSGRFVYEYEAIGFERIVLPIGTYNALRIDVTAEGYIDPSRVFSPSFESTGCVWSSAQVDDVDPVLSLTFKGSAWWASGIGWIKKAGTLSNAENEVIIESYEAKLESFGVP